MSPVHRDYIRRETLVALAINSVLSFAFSFLTLHGRAALPLWGGGGMAVDFVPQLFMMTFATTLAVTLLTRRRARSGAVAHLPAPRRWPLPRTAVLRAVLFGVVAVALLAPPSVWALAAAGVATAPAAGFVLGKVAYGAVVSLVIARPIILSALWAPAQSPFAGGGDPAP